MPFHCQLLLDHSLPLGSSGLLWEERPCGRTGPPSLSSVWLGTKVKRQQKPPPAPEDSQEGLLPVYVTYCLVDVSTTFSG